VVTTAAPLVVVVVTAAEARDRIDRVLSVHVPDVSRSEVQRWIEAGAVSVDGVVASSRTKLKTGARIEATPLPPATTEARPEDIPLSILFEDEHLLVVDKPAGLVVHPAAGHASGTLVNAYLHHVGGDASLDEADPARPGIVHRLDKDTSGVMVIAKTPVAREALMARFAAHDLERAYLGIALGTHPLAATYDTFHARHPGDRKRFTSKVTKGRRAVTHVERLELLAGASLVRCRLETGRTHQIRVHLAEHGHPLLGDPVYGSRPRDARLRAVGDALGRQALHAAVLGFPHPITGAALRFEAPLPPDLTKALEALRSVPI
jgi:23S rRNA pseudouridine1911/1915/1917 synthase